MKLANAIVEVGLNRSKLESGLGQVKGLLGSFAASVGGAYMFRAGIEAAAENQAANARLAGVIRATGAAAGYTSDQMIEMAESLSHVVRMTDEEIKGGAALLATFKSIQGDAFQRTMEVAIDLAEVMGTGLNSAVLQLGKALEDPTTGLTALRRSGVSFTEAEQDLIKSLVETNQKLEAQEMILKAVEGQVGGTARAMNAGAAGGLADFTKAIDQIKEDLGMGLAPALGVGAAALSELVRVGHGAADWAADFAYGIDRAAERMHAAEQGARDLAKGIREAEQAADAAFNKEEADRFDAILGGDGAGRAPFDALAEKYRQQTRTAAAPDAMAGREAAALAQYQNELKRIDAMLDKVRADGKPVTSEMQRAADAARDAAEALANVKLSDVNADRAQALADGLAKAADEARRAQQAIDDSIASLRGMERGAEIDLAKAMGLDEKAGGMEIDAWLEDKLAGIDQFIADRVGSGAGMSIDEDEQLAALRAKYEEIARLRKDELGDGGAKELSYRAASLREIGLAAAGKLGAPPAAEHDEEADAAKATADNTEKMVDLLEEIDFGGKWK